MTSTVKASLKKLFYLAPQKDALRGKELYTAAILHVEQLYDQEVFRRLIEFCRAYTALTQAKPICTCLAPTNARVIHGMLEHGVLPSTLLQRLRTLTDYASIGYHGHYWLDPHACFELSSDIRSVQHLRSAVAEQVERDLSWFSEHEIDLNRAYAAGWWFVSTFVYETLARRGFRYDFSLSKSRWFFNAWSHNLFVRHGVAAGQSIRYYLDNGKSMLCIQNLVGMCAGDHRLDLNRYMLQLSPLADDRLIGVFNAHDYDLAIERALGTFVLLQQRYDCRILSLGDLVRVAEEQARDIKE